VAVFALIISTLNFPAALLAQEQKQIIKRVRFTKGQNATVVKGQVSPEGNRYLYFFRARKGQRLTVLLTSVDNNAVCDIGAHHQFDYEPITEEVTEWSGVLPRADAGEYSIEVRSLNETARYTLKITIK
jgi:hypothetical protein